MRIILLFILTFSQTAAAMPSPSKFLNAIGAALMNNQKTPQPATLSDLNKALFESVRAGNLAATERLIKEGAELEAKNHLGWTPLHYAGLNNFNDILHLLINKGANVNAQDNFGWTPLHHASLNGIKAVIELLLSKKGDPNIINNSGRNSYDVAKNDEIQTFLAARYKKSACQPAFK